MTTFPGAYRLVPILLNHGIYTMRYVLVDGAWEWDGTYRNSLADAQYRTGLRYPWADWGTEEEAA